MTIPSSLTAGEHVLLADPAVSWDAAVSDSNPPAVVLTASIKVPQEHTAAATVAIQMDGQVALQLYGKLYALVRSLGWLPEE